MNKKTVSRWGILSIKNKNKNYFQINDVIEKPSVKNAPSNYAIIGRYILPVNIFDEIKNLNQAKVERYILLMQYEILFIMEINFLGIFSKVNIWTVELLMVIFNQVFKFLKAINENMYDRDGLCWFS